MNEQMIRQGLDTISSVDRQLAKALDEGSYPQPRVRPAKFETFVSIIVSQQISVKAAQSILANLKAKARSLTADNLLSLEFEELRSVGLSQRKAEYIQGIAEANKNGTLKLSRLRKLDDEAAIAEIVQLRGLGRWSAEIFLMFSLGRQDVFPADDLAIRQALQKLKGLDEIPTAKEARELTSHWSPWRSAGSLFLWHFHKGMPA